MDDLLHVLLALAAVVAPLALAWWLLRERPRRGGGQRRGEGEAPRRSGGPASE